MADQVTKGVVWLETALATVVVVFRLCVRVKYPPGLSKDDAFIVAALLCLIAMR